MTDSCGYAVPIYTVMSRRSALLTWSDTGWTIGCKAVDDDVPGRAVWAHGRPTACLGTEGMCRFHSSWSDCRRIDTDRGWLPYHHLLSIISLAPKHILIVSDRRKRYSSGRIKQNSGRTSRS
ncbi:hypothetical protein BD311DRAFT_492395 [Dichomitus squalens]|uniref:Uncharacterized protein n=1 Tax=Dichomitus squalens TaxID=114155 RepID=A0A4Q9MEK0_9APHY|nr:hypothetical protein BD311DRAFT_492395 [Dichomitus squalens]